MKTLLFLWAQSYWLIENSITLAVFYRDVLVFEWRLLSCSAQHQGLETAGLCPSKIHMWKPGSPMWWRWGLWEVIRAWQWYPHVGISVFRRHSRFCFPLSTIWGHRLINARNVRKWEDSPLQTRKSLFTKNPICLHPDLRLQPPEPEGKNVCCLSTLSMIICYSSSQLPQSLGVPTRPTD